MRAPSSDFPLGSASSFGPESAPQLRPGGRETRRPAKEVAASAVGERRRRAVHPPAPARVQPFVLCPRPRAQKGS